jgi:hypothetical protein
VVSFFSVLLVVALEFFRMRLKILFAVIKIGYLDRNPVTRAAGRDNIMMVC